ncbi:MAG: hypothetical protein P4M08_06810 [Oligoflexia bacterium]|nr:hypothetical protein [Oligoflexia bacterium]
MKTHRVSSKISATLACVSLVSLSCNENTLTPLTQNEFANLHYVNVDAQFCTSEPENSQQKIKYLFLIDHSASNQPLFGSPLVAGDDNNTDPVGARRYGPLVQFVNGVIQNPNPSNLTSFALIDFNSNAYAPGYPGAYVNISAANPTATATTQTFDTDPNDFLNTYVIPDWEGCFNNSGQSQNCLGTATNPQPFDVGFTNYQSALAAAQDLIYNDLEAEATSLVTPPVKIDYVIIMVTDGFPNVASPNPPGYTPQSFSVDLQGVIQNIINYKSNPTFGPLISNISLNTAYYYPSAATPDQNDENLLQQMSALGLGKSQVFGNGSSVVYQSYAPVSRQVKYNLADVWIENENAVWWDNGQLMLDSDGDGLPDLIESQLGSNPFVQDSDGNGVSDLVEYRAMGKPCKDASCSPANRNPYAVCDGLSPSTDASGNVTFPYSAKDGLNDCEKLVLNGTQANFDSNGDFLPDLMEFKANLPFVLGASGAFLNPYGDPLNNYQKLKAGLPVSISQAKVLNFNTRQITLEHVQSTTPDNQCYHLIAGSVAALNGGNSIKISVIQNTAVIDNVPILQTAVRALNGMSDSVYFVPTDFK